MNGREDDETGRMRGSTVRSRGSSERCAGGGALGFLFYVTECPRPIVYGSSSLQHPLSNTNHCRISYELSCIPPSSVVYLSMPLLPSLPFHFTLDKGEVITTGHIDIASFICVYCYPSHTLGHFPLIYRSNLVRFCCAYFEHWVCAPAAQCKGREYRTGMGDRQGLTMVKDRRLRGYSINGGDYGQPDSSGRSLCCD